MGFNSSFTGKEQNLEHETLDYLRMRPEVGNAMTALMIELKRLGRNKKSPENENVSGIKVSVKNQHGQQMAMTVVGVNSTSLISSEMEGHLAFTFIKNIESLEIFSDKSADAAKEMHLTLIKG